MLERTDMIHGYHKTWQWDALRINTKTWPNIRELAQYCECEKGKNKMVGMAQGLNIGRYIKYQPLRIEILALQYRYFNKYRLILSNIGSYRAASLIQIPLSIPRFKTLLWLIWVPDEVVLNRCPIILLIALTITSSLYWTKNLFESSGFDEKVNQTR